MSKSLTAPASRLICFGGARAHTNFSDVGSEQEIDVPQLRYDP